MSEIKAAVSTVKKETESKQASVVIQNKDKQITDSYKEFRHSLLQLESEVKKLLPEHIPFSKFERNVLTAIQMTPDLLNADRKSLFNACLKSASDGLIPDGREAALVVYFTRDGKMAQYLPMTYGIIKKIRNSGELGKIVLQMIFENDKFKYFIDEGGEKIVHEPNILGDRGQPKGVYAIIVTKDGNSYIEVMSADEVMQVQKASKAKNGPWQGDFKYEMWKKTVLRRLSKRVPMNSEVERVIQNEDEFIDFKMANENQDKGKQIEKLLEQKPEDEKTEQPVEEKEKTPFESFEGDVK